MSEYIEGEWKDYEFKMVTTADADLVAKHVREHFLPEETMNKFLGWSEENAVDHDRLVYWALSHGMSFIVLHKETQELAGVNLLLKGQTAGDGLVEVKPESQICKTIFGFLATLDEVTHEAFRNNFDSNYAEIFITAVPNKFGGHGIATEMYRRSLEYLKAKGFKTVKSGFSSPGTRKIGAKLGFDEIGRLYYKAHTKENGEKSFPTAGDEDFMQEVAKSL
jgi:predicted GNAT family acetyltransferase